MKRDTEEKPLALTTNGYAFLVVALVLLAIAGYSALNIFASLKSSSEALIAMGPTDYALPIVLIVIAFFIFKGLSVIPPNEAIVATFLGTYMGSVKKSGFWFIVPLYSKQKISLRSRNLNGHTLKVNDKAGNPIEIAAVIVWQVDDTAKALFDVDDYDIFVSIQSEAAVRKLATSYSYDSNEGDKDITLRDATGHINDKLEEELNDRLYTAGVQVIESRISHLAYAPEIAMAMLQRQQANAVVSARTQIVEGAVGMVEMAVDRLEANKTVELNAAERAKLASNLLVVLCSESNVTPTVNMANS